MSALRKILGALNPFRSDGSELYPVPGMRHLLEKHVRSPEDQLQIKKVADEFESEIGQIVEEIEQAREEVQNANRDRDIDRIALKGHLDHLAALQSKRQKTIFDYRLRMKYIVTALQWEKIKLEAKPLARKAWQERQNQIAEWNKVRENLETLIKKHVSDKHRAEKACGAIREVWVRLADMQQAGNLNPTSDDVLKRADASETELNTIAREIDTLREFAFESYLNAHFTIVEQTTEEEWNKITKGSFF